MPEPRIFVLARDGWEEPLEYYERRNGEPFDPCHRDHAMEIAPGVHVAMWDCVQPPYRGEVLMWPGEFAVPGL